MTCVIGIANGTDIWMGADSMASDGYLDTITKLPKVFVRGELLIGFTTSFRMGQILQYNAAIPHRIPDISDEAYVIGYVVDNFRSVLKDLGYSKVDNNTQSGGDVLIGYRGALYKMSSDFGVIQSASGIDAIGIGRTFALGSLWTTRRVKSEEKRLKIALEAASALANGVCAPYHIIRSPDIHERVDNANANQ